MIQSLEEKVTDPVPQVRPKRERRESSEKYIRRVREYFVSMLPNSDQTYETLR